MQTLAYGARGLRLLAHLNADRFLMVGVLGLSLWMAAYFGVLL